MNIKTITPTPRIWTEDQPLDERIRLLAATECDRIFATRAIRKLVEDAQRPWQGPFRVDPIIVETYHDDLSVSMLVTFAVGWIGADDRFFPRWILQNGKEAIARSVIENDRYTQGRESR